MRLNIIITTTNELKDAFQRFHNVRVSALTLSLLAFIRDITGTYVLGNRRIRF